MFITTRVVNGVVAMWSLFVSWSLLSLAPFASTLWLHGLFFGAVTLASIVDLLCRKQHSISDFAFAILWTLFFSYAVFVGVVKFSWDIPAVVGGPLFFALIVVLMYGLPLLLNGIYLVRLFKQKKVTA